MSVAVAFHHQLMGPADGLQVVLVQEFLADVLAPAISRPSRRRSEAILALIRGIGPQQVAKWARMRHILHPIDASQLIKGINFRGEAAMQTEDLILNLRGNGQTLEQISKHLPNEVRSVFLEALIIEAVKFINLSVLVISPEDGDSASVFDLEQKDVEEGFNAVEAAIDVIPHEEIVGVLSKKEGTGNFPQI